MRRVLANSFILRQYTGCRRKRSLQIANKTQNIRNKVQDKMTTGHKETIRIITMMKYKYGYDPAMGLCHCHALFLSFLRVSFLQVLAARNTPNGGSNKTTAAIMRCRCRYFSPYYSSHCSSPLNNDYQINKWLGVYRSFRHISGKLIRIVVISVVTNHREEKKAQENEAIHGAAIQWQKMEQKEKRMHSHHIRTHNVKVIGQLDMSAERAHTPKQLLRTIAERHHKFKWILSFMLLCVR